MQKQVINYNGYYISFMLEFLDSYISKESISKSMCLHITNYTKQRIEGHLVINVPDIYEVSPEDNLIMAVKTDGTISFEFIVTTKLIFEKDLYTLKANLKTITGDQLNVEFDIHMKT